MNISKRFILMNAFWVYLLPAAMVVLLFYKRITKFTSFVDNSQKINMLQYLSFVEIVESRRFCLWTQNLKVVATKMYKINNDPYLQLVMKLFEKRTYFWIKYTSNKCSVFVNLKVFSSSFEDFVHKTNENLYNFNSFYQFLI